MQKSCSGLLSAVCLSLFVSGCRCGSEGEQATTSRIPLKITESNFDDLDGKSAEELECVAEPQLDELLQREESVFTAITVETGKQSVQQKATFREGVKAVEAGAGGCAHVGASFTFISPEYMVLESDEERLAVVLSELEALPLTKAGNGWRESILRTVTTVLEQGEERDDFCHFPETEGYSWVFCSLGEERADGGVKSRVLQIAYTVAL